MKTAKHIFKVLSVISFAISLTACNEEVLNESNKTENQYGTMVFTAEAPTTHTSLEADNKVYWNDGDDIVVVPEYGSYIQNLEDYKFTTSIPEQKVPNAEFIGKTILNKLYYIAFYPFEQCIQIGRSNVGPCIFFNIPQKQIATAGSFAPNTNPAWTRATISPIDNVATDANLQFKNIGALVKLTLKGVSNLKSITLTDMNSEIALTGDLQYDMDDNTTPLKTSPGWSSNYKNRVTLEGNFQDATYYMVIAPIKGALSQGFTLTFNRNDGTAYIKKAKEGIITEVAAGETINLGEINLSNADFQPMITDTDFIAAVETEGATRDVYYTQFNINWEKQYGMVPLTEENKQKIESVATLEIFSKNLFSLDYVHYFKNLYLLGCGYNNLSTLDVSSLQGLGMLFCQGNNLSSLNVSTLTNLATLDCQGNSLTILDLSINTELKNLYCGNQKNGTLHLILNRSMQKLWDENWALSSENENVEVTYVD